MVPPFDIFRVTPDGQLLWKAAAEDLERAQQRVKLLMRMELSDYVIYSQKTGNKMLISAENPP